MNIPIKNQLKKRSQQELAKLQDEVIDLAYSIDQNIIFHGGTSIWRCYNGKRFSEDLDIYLNPKNDFEIKLKQETKKRGLNLTKFRKTENSIFAKISNSQTECSLEIGMREKQGVFGTYENSDGTTINVIVLSAEELIIEKALAFKNRKLIRDIYDVYFLLNKVDLNKVEELSKIVKEFDKPVDEKNLKTLIYSGVAPNYETMLNTIKRQIK